MKRLTIRIDDDLYEKLRKESFESIKSMNEIVSDQIKKRYGEGKVENNNDQKTIQEDIKW